MVSLSVEDHVDVFWCSKWTFVEVFRAKKTVNDLSQWFKNWRFDTVSDGSLLPVGMNPAQTGMEMLATVIRSSSRHLFDPKAILEPKNSSSNNA